MIDSPIGVGGRNSKTRTGAEFQHADIELVQRELLGVVAKRVCFERIAVLIAEIVDIVQTEGAEPIPVGFGGKPVVEQQARRQHGLRARPNGGIGLIAQAGLGEAAELVRQQLLVDRSEEIFGSLPQLRRDVRHLERGREILVRHLVGAEPVIKHAELEAHRGRFGL